MLAIKHILLGFFHTIGKPFPYKHYFTQTFTINIVNILSHDILMFLLSIFLG